MSDTSEDSEPGVEQPDRVERFLEVESGCRDLCRGPPPTARLAVRPKWLPPQMFFTPSKGNPVFGLRMQLYCRTGFHIAIFGDKKVRGLDIDQHRNGEPMLYFVLDRYIYPKTFEGLLSVQTRLGQLSAVPREVD